MGKVCIIGGGPIGVGVSRWLKKYGFDFDIIEKQNDFGGLWNISSEESRRVYKSAHLISCKSITEISDSKMPASYSAYPRHDQVLNYFRELAKTSNLYAHAYFNTKVESLFLNDKQQWDVTFSNQEKKTYNAVVIANGLLNKPLMPIYSGKFSGQILHSGNYFDVDPFKNKRVLVVGAGNSGCDIVSDLCRYADKVYHSTRRNYHYMPKFIYGLPTQEWMMKLTQEIRGDQNEYWREVERSFKMAGYDPTDYGLGKADYPIYASHPIVNSLVLYFIGHGDIISKPDIHHYDGNRVTFIDDTECEVDTIIYATGFRPDLPFLHESQFNVNDIFSETFTRSLHKKYDNLFFLGYANSPAGLGGMLNFAGKMISLLLRAYFESPKLTQVIHALKNGPEPDLGNGVYIQSDRHVYEYDLWKTIKFMRSMIDKLESELK